MTPSVSRHHRPGASWGRPDVAVLPVPGPQHQAHQLHPLRVVERRERHHGGHRLVHVPRADLPRPVVRRPQRAELHALPLELRRGSCHKQLLLGVPRVRRNVDPPLRGGYPRVALLHVSIVLQPRAGVCDSDCAGPGPHGRQQPVRLQRGRVGACGGPPPLRDVQPAASRAC